MKYPKPPIESAERLDPLEDRKSRAAAALNIEMTDPEFREYATFIRRKMSIPAELEKKMSQRYPGILDQLKKGML